MSSTCVEHVRVIFSVASGYTELYSNYLQTGIQLQRRISFPLFHHIGLPNRLTSLQFISLVVLLS
jgi:hypothetical protein